MSVLEFLGKGLALAAFVFSVFTYAYNLYREREQDRYEKAVAMVDEYTSAGIRDHENALDLKLLYYTTSVDINDAAQFPDAMFKLIADETLFGYKRGKAETEPFLPKLFDISDFYAEAAFCAEARICDREIVEAYFCRRAESFTTKHARLLKYYEDYSRSQDWRLGFDKFQTLCG